MTEIDLERGNRNRIWPWVAGLLALALVIWGVTEAMETGDDGEVETVQTLEPVEPAATLEPAGDDLTMGEIVSSPESHIGERYLPGEVEVGEVPTERGFWIEEDGERLFAVLSSDPEELDRLEEGQRLRIQEGVLQDADYVRDWPGAPLDEETQRIAENEPVVLMVSEQNIQRLDDM